MCWFEAFVKVGELFRIPHNVLGYCGSFVIHQLSYKFYTCLGVHLSSWNVYRKSQGV